eukprot:1575505-Amphidinium_carterae.1
MLAKMCVCVCVNVGSESEPPSAAAAAEQGPPHEQSGLEGGPQQFKDWLIDYREQKWSCRDCKGQWLKQSLPRSSQRSGVPCPVCDLGVSNCYCVIHAWLPVWQSATDETQHSRCNIPRCNFTHVQMSTGVLEEKLCIVHVSVECY